MRVRETPNSGITQDMGWHSEASTGESLCRSIAAIYKPIQSQMIDLEMQLDALIDDAPSDLAKNLAHALKGGGKRLRPALVLLAGNVYPGKSEPLMLMALL